MERFNHLLIHVEDPYLKVFYEEKIKIFNEKIRTSAFPDSGFDLYCPETITVSSKETKKIDLKIQCAMYRNIYYEDVPVTKQYVGYYLYPRSSISKTPLRLANSVGIIDSGYRGNVCAMVDNIKSDDYVVEKYTRLFQICSPTLEPLQVRFVDNLDDFKSTLRGTGGFGSTGSA